MGRKPCCQKEGLHRGPWTAQEDEKLISFIKHNQNHGNWHSLPRKAGLLRCGKSCRLRWNNYLNPDIKRGDFSLDEEEKIITLHALVGNKWAFIASQVPKRTDNEIKNYWNTVLKKRLRKRDPDFSCSSTNINGHSELNLSHYIQWESARLEAEKRLAEEAQKRTKGLWHVTSAKRTDAVALEPPSMRKQRSEAVSKPSLMGPFETLHSMNLASNLEKLLEKQMQDRPLAIPFSSPNGQRSASSNQKVVFRCDSSSSCSQDDSKSSINTDFSRLSWNKHEYTALTASCTSSPEGYSSRSNDNSTSNADQRDFAIEKARQSASTEGHNDSPEYNALTSFQDLHDLLFVDDSSDSVNSQESGESPSSRIGSAGCTFDSRHKNNKNESFHELENILSSWDESELQRTPPIVSTTSYLNSMSEAADLDLFSCELGMQASVPLQQLQYDGFLLAQEAADYNFKSPENVLQNYWHQLFTQLTDTSPLERPIGDAIEVAML